jgi:hypothetical protein
MRILLWKVSLFLLVNKHGPSPNKALYDALIKRMSKSYSFMGHLYIQLGRDCHVCEHAFYVVVFH